MENFSFTVHFMGMNFQPDFHIKAAVYRLSVKMNFGNSFFGASHKNSIKLDWTQNNSHLSGNL